MIQNQAKILVLNKIHETAVISPNAKLGKDVEIGPCAIIGNNVSIGDGTKIGANAVIDGWTNIGRNCRIHAGASIGSDPQDKKFIGEKGYVRIGDHTHIREFVTINRGIGKGRKTQIGSNCLLLAYSHVAHNCMIGNHVVMSNAVNLAGHVMVEDRVTIGGFARIHRFVKIGRNAMIGGFSKVVQDVPPYIMVDGNVAKIAGLNKIGMLRAGIEEATRKVMKRAYKLLYYSGLDTGQALEAMEQDLPKSEELESFTAFLRNSKSGICQRVSKQKR
ncbi:acyl-ACP--UDP-N-acetylglucosamine O-acyltransferase [Pelosinus propionicus]|uniref:Acyl-[acyl-carrier-protein]--UDP-N-acetylglucosamine O-acyltransferase n=1 Tax=Pelosinus propionicus DSM 13327 TaxID=1123291 RepID=A0A1I4NB93_9FIRM|nr:acyl-ACP--UDP-N-acetylglucosamine O-acyltransferase [Pelosinus propionicus]SFM12560.1 acyl-[acyl-carrier-protein]--UDP-N-acetylglucosamine O-acyltransferase [Pelosinus propionicus DSM 13327]